jgi:Uncharacterized conserved protein (DUF2190)
MAESPVLVRPKRNKTANPIPRGSAVKLYAKADDEIELCAADTDVFYGVAHEDIAAGKWGDIGVIGTYRCLAGGAVTRGERVGPAAGGKFVPVTGDGQTVAGVAEQEAKAADAVIEVTLGVGITLSVPVSAAAAKKAAAAAKEATAAAKEAVAAAKQAVAAAKEAAKGKHSK